MYEKDPQLGTWVNNQRTAYKKKKKAEECKRLLNSIGFVWGAITVTWEEMYERLVAYKMEHNHCMVPKQDKEDPQLRTWVNTQRRSFRENKMTDRRTRLLNSVSFVWNANATLNFMRFF